MIEPITLQLLQVAMDISQTRHQAAAANIAAANVPGAKQVSVDFDQLIQSLTEADNSTRELLLQDIRANWSAEKNQATTFDGNSSINLDEQSAELLLSSGKFRVLTEGLNRKMGLMQVAVNGGKR